MPAVDTQHLIRLLDTVTAVLGEARVCECVPRATLDKAAASAIRLIADLAEVAEHEARAATTCTHPKPGAPVSADVRGNAYDIPDHQAPAGRRTWRRRLRARLAALSARLRPHRKRT
jgi:hypothetical protein